MLPNWSPFSIKTVLKPTPAMKKTFSKSKKEFKIEKKKSKLRNFSKIGKIFSKPRIFLKKMEKLYRNLTKPKTFKKCIVNNVSILYQVHMLSVVVVDT